MSWSEGIHRLSSRDLSISQGRGGSHLPSEKEFFLNAPVVCLVTTVNRIKITAYCFFENRDLILT